ncbi:hypothetical protein ACJMK2_007148, partial [Sinanodonta woodiana]
MFLPYKHTTLQAKTFTLILTSQQLFKDTVESDREYNINVINNWKVQTPLGEISICGRDETRQELTTNLNMYVTTRKARRL